MIVYYKSHGFTQRLDPEQEPIAIILSDKDKQNIVNMAEGDNIYCVYSDTTLPKEIKEWLAVVRNLEEEHTK